MQGFALRQLRRAAHHEPQLRRLVHDLVERDPGEVGELQLDDRAQPGQGSADAAAHEPPGSADGLSWEPFSPDAVSRYRATGRPVFVDFTAAWCVSCKVNESLVFSSEEVRQRLRDLHMVLLKADWTNQDPIITQTLAQFGRSGVPLYVIYPKETEAPPVQLPEGRGREQVAVAEDLVDDVRLGRVERHRGVAEAGELDSAPLLCGGPGVAPQLSGDVPPVLVFRPAA